MRKEPLELTTVKDRSVLNPEALRCQVIPPDSAIIQRLKRVMRIAYRLKWTQPGKGGQYPLMQCSEVEKCLLMMASDEELRKYDNPRPMTDEDYLRSAKAEGGPFTPLREVLNDMPESEAEADHVTRKRKIRKPRGPFKPHP